MIYGNDTHTHTHEGRRQAARQEECIGRCTLLIVFWFLAWMNIHHTFFLGDS